MTTTPRTLGRPRLIDYHGTVAGYRNHGCKCPACRAAHARTVKSWRHRTRADHDTGIPQVRTTVDAKPVETHLAGLRASGWNYKQLADETDVSPAALARIGRGDRTRVRAATAVAILNVEPLPTVSIDEVVVDRLIAAYPDSIWREIGATRPERIQAADELLARCRRLRDAQRRAGVASQWADGPARNEIERCLSLRAGRDFGLIEAMAS
jgi:hypothetical protein